MGSQSPPPPPTTITAKPRGIGMKRKGKNSSSSSSSSYSQNGNKTRRQLNLSESGLWPYELWLYKSKHYIRFCCDANQFFLERRERERTGGTRRPEIWIYVVETIANINIGVIFRCVARKPDRLYPEFVAKPAKVSQIQIDVTNFPIAVWWCCCCCCCWLPFSRWSWIYKRNIVCQYCIKIPPKKKKIEI